MTEVNITTVDAQVAITASNNQVVITEQPVRIEATVQNNIVTVNETTNQLTIQVPTAPTVTIQEPTGGTIILDTSTPSLATLLDSVRTDIRNTGFDYEGDQLTSVTREGITKKFTYNVDGTLNTLETITGTKTVLETFNYGSNGLESITVT